MQFPGKAPDPLGDYQDNVVTEDEFACYISLILLAYFKAVTELL